MRTALVALVTLLAVVLAPLAPGGSAAAQSFGCERGEAEVRAVDFVGNRAFTDELLETTVYVTASSWTRRYLRVVGVRRCLNRDRFPLDRAALIVFYRRKGYPDVVVDTVVRDLGDNRVDITFRITEGRPIIVDTLYVKGLEEVRDSARIVRNLPLRVGRPFDVYAEAAMLDTLRRRLRDNGYPDADVFRESRTNRPSYSAVVTPLAVPGVYARLGEIRTDVSTMGGDRRHVSDAAVRRVMGLRPGRPYSERDLIDARRRLFLTDAFRQVDVRPDTGRQPGDSVVNVIAHLLEGDMYSARVGAGYATLDCFRTSGALTARNLNIGRIDITGRVSKIGIGRPLDWSRGLCQGAANDPYSDRLNYYAGATLTQGAVPGLRAFSLTFFSERRSEYKAYLRTVPIGTVVSRDFERFRPVLATAAYDLTYGQTTAEPALFCAVFLVCDPSDQQALQEKKVQAALSLTLTRRRVDSDIEPRRGVIAQASVRSASRFFGSDTSLQFNRLQGEVAWYTPHRRNVLAARMQLGTVLGTTFSLRGANVPSFIPPAERMFAGGANTVRGYRQNLLGPVVYVAEAIDTVQREDDPNTYYEIRTGTGAQERPTGGNSLVVANLEYRIRSPFLSDYLQWVVFGDVGQVWNRGSGGGQQINFAFDSLRFTPGLGFRIATPIGAIRVDVGYNPNERPKGAVYHSRTLTVLSTDGTTEVDFPQFFCVTPGNTNPIVAQTVSVGGRFYEVPTQDVTNCSSGYSAGPRRGLNRLTLNLSIGQAF